MSGWLCRGVGGVGDTRADLRVIAGGCIGCDGEASDVVASGATVWCLVRVNRPGFGRDSLLGSGDQADQVAVLIQGLELRR